MLKKMNECGVESDKGFSIQVVHPEILEYRENNLMVEINIGYDPKKRIVFIYASEITGIKEEDKKIMIKNIKEAAKLLSNYEVV